MKMYVLSFVLFCFTAAFFLHTTMNSYVPYQLWNNCPMEYFAAVKMDDLYRSPRCVNGKK